MHFIFHEKQEGALCAQHCLNSLLQSEYFSAVDLAEIASDLDKQEQYFMYDRESGNRSLEQQQSSNYDDSGFFSIQVLQKALTSFSLELIPYQSQNQIALLAQSDPTTQLAYICNFKEHWYSIRKFAGTYWFNLNSLFKKPQYVSDTYLSVLLAQLVTDGYSIFIVNGNLPQCQADDTLIGVPKEVLMAQYAAPIEAKKTVNRSQFYENNFDDDDDDNMRAAIEASLKHDEHEIKSDFSYQNAIKSSENEYIESEENEIKRAIELSLQNESGGDAIKVDPQIEKNEVPNTSKSFATNQPVNTEEIRRKRLEKIEKLNQKPKEEN